MSESNDLSKLASVVEDAYRDWQKHPESDACKRHYESVAKLLDDTLKAFKDSHCNHPHPHSR